MADAPKAYIADANNKRQIETGREWAKTCHYDSTTKTTTYCEGKEYTFDNEGFTLELSGSPSSSWRGGKLSFCMCTIKKDGHTWTTGINSDLLIELLKQSECLKGVVQGNIAFARKNGQVGAVLVGSESYKDAVKDGEIRKKASKTTKAQMGFEHKALYANNVWMLDVYDWVENLEASALSHDSAYSYWHGGVSTMIPYLRISKPVKKHIFPSTFALKIAAKYINDECEIIGGKIKTAGEVLLDAAYKLKEDIDNDRCRYSRDVPILNDMHYDGAVVKFPARAVGRQLMTLGVTDKQWEEFRSIVIDCIYQPNVDSRKADTTYFNRNNIGILAGISLTDSRDELPDVDTVREWVEGIDGCLIVDYFGEIIQSKKLKERIEKHVISDLKLPEIKEA